jgi:long-chain acyl-CoA synthetase
MSRGPVLLTGATGFLGMELLVRLLEHTDRDVVALVRAGDDTEAAARMDGVLDTLFARGTIPGRRRVRAVAADLEQPGLGLSAPARDRLARESSAVVHCAASISFSQPLEDARRINVGGTRAVLGLAEDIAAHGGLERLVHVSTAYVAGERTGRVRERQGDVGQSFRNTYEQTKLEAEAHVHDSGLPAAILRPSIVVGDSVTGWTPAFNVIYWPLLAFARGLLPSVPADPGAHVDIVCVDTVADALLELVEGPVRCGALHAVAGDDSPTCGELATMAAEAFGCRPPEFVAPGTDPSAEDRAGVFLPYFRMGMTFDATRGRALGFRPPALEDYFPALMDYAREARWGKRPMPRWAAASRSAAAAA